MATMTFLSHNIDVLQFILSVAVGDLSFPKMLANWWSHLSGPNTPWIRQRIL